MTNEELLTACKIGLQIDTENTALDGILLQKILAVKSYMRGAGVTEDNMLDDLAVGVIVMGVADLWSLEGGGVKFSPAFHVLLAQLAVG